MIYLDNSATTYPKPDSVSGKVNRGMKISSNPGRSSHFMSMRAAQEIFSVRSKAKTFFGTESEENVIFCSGCTEALNTAIKGYIRSGSHVVVSDLEHNAVMRPLEKLKSIGVTCTRAKTEILDDDKTVDNFRKAINSKTGLIVCTQASNVWGIRLPVERLCALAHSYGIRIIVDAAQSAGVIPIDMRDGYDAVCIPGHKGLYGPMGVGMLLLPPEPQMDTIIEGGTGSSSLSLDQPEELPDRFESGTPNLPGIAGLGAGIDFVDKKGREKIFRHEMKLITELYDRLSHIPGIRLYTPEPDEEHFVPVLSFNAGDHDSEETAAYLSKKGIAVRAGLHCSPCAHEAMGTAGTGAVRISPSVFTVRNDIHKLVYHLKSFR